MIVIIVIANVNAPINLGIIVEAPGGCLCTYLDISLVHPGPGLDASKANAKINIATICFIMIFSI
jgi:hypothetical protein